MCFEQLRMATACRGDLLQLAEAGLNGAGGRIGKHRTVGNENDRASHALTAHNGADAALYLARNARAATNRRPQRSLIRRQGDRDLTV